MCLIWEGGVPLYRLIVSSGSRTWCIVEVQLGAVKGQGGNGIHFRELRRCSEAWWRTQWWSASSLRRARL